MNRILAALLHVAVAVAGVLGAAIAAPRDLSVWAQIAVVALGAAVTYIVPLTNAKWRAWLKVMLGAVIPAAIIAALPFIPVVGHGFDPQNALPLIMAVLVAIGTQLGVDVRTNPIPAPDSPAVLSSLPTPAVVFASTPEASGGD